MKLKYYLRGLGIGIAVTAAVLMLAGGGKENLTDAEIIARAKELGMVESVILSQLSSEAEQEIISEDNSAEDIDSEVPEDVSEEADNSETFTNDSSEVSSENSSEEVSEAPSEIISEEDSSQPVDEVVEEFVIIEVGPGDGSDAVSIKLENAGLVEDAQMYDDFLCANGYDKILQTGVHEIPRTADWDMIAEILAGRM